MKRVLIYTILLVLCVIPVMISDTFADGCYFPAKAYRTSPVIHSQRAILKYKDGVETLVIESSFDGEGKDFGWVIPLPAKPTNFEEASAGFLETLSRRIQPVIQHELAVYVYYLFFPTLIVAIYFILTLFNNKNSLSALLAMIFMLLLFSSIMMPSMGVTKGGDSSSSRRGVDVLDVQEVGSFGLVVLEADDSQSLDDWLLDNGYAGLKKTERQIVSDYINEGWCFVVAKLKRDGEGYTEPHPLAMTFESEKPVYPMRLTAAADSEVYLELFVIADKAASYPGLTTEYVSLYSHSLRENKSEYNGLYRGSIGHPESDNFMWDKCFLTRLCDVLGPEDMKEDIVVELNEGEVFFRKYYFSHKGAFGLGLFIGDLVWCCAIVVLSVWFNRKNADPLNWKGKVKKVFVPAICLMFVICGGVYFFVEKLDTVEVPSNRGVGELIMPQSIMKSITFDIQKGIFDDCKSVADVEKKLRNEVFPAIIRENQKYVKKIKLEDSPGNASVHEDDRGLVIRIFRRGGFYQDIVLADKGV